MGLLTEGTPLPWVRARQYAEHVRARGVGQFVRIWGKNVRRGGDARTWGDELESMVVRFDHENRRAVLALQQGEMIGLLRSTGAGGGALGRAEAGEALAQSACRPAPEFDPEYGSYMIETSPGRPYAPSLQGLLEVEPDMRHRRQVVDAHLRGGEAMVTMCCWPRMGAGGQGVGEGEGEREAGGHVTRSVFLGDGIINPHPRYSTITANVNARRGRKVCINVPIFHDTHTARPFVDPTIPFERNIFPEDAETKAAARPDHIYMDALAFGAGCCCVQVTLQLADLAEARGVHDALVPVAPIMLALSAAAPAYRGFLADVDCRWNVIRDTADDRTEAEMGLKPLREGDQRIPKSRYDSSDSYISLDAINRPEYSDNPLPVNEGAYRQLVENGVDELMARHVAHLFIRDPIVLLEEYLEQDDEVSMGHFENIQSTNWQTLRFKPASQDGRAGWRVEFRACEAQFTDGENAALCVFVVLLARAIGWFGLDLYVPVSRVDENMQRAQGRGAVRGERFWWRKKVAGAEELAEGIGGTGDVYDVCELMTVDEIINGKGEEFPGLLGYVKRYLKAVNVEPSVEAGLEKYLELIRRRANGELMTNAAWIRQFIRSHPAYMFDSVVSEEVNYDLVKAIYELERDAREEPSLLP